MIRQRTSCSEVSRTSQCLPLSSEINSRVMKFKAITIQTISHSKLNMLNIPRRMQLKVKDFTIKVLLCSYSVHYKATKYKLVDEERGYLQNQNPVKVVSEVSMVVHAFRRQMDLCELKPAQSIQQSLSQSGLQNEILSQ